MAQSYTRFEYILVDNCSTDGSSEIAERYAQRDARIRLIKRSRLVSQVQNYNASLAEISVDSEYCKIVQADDFIFPDCLRLMVEAFLQSESIGLVSAYDLKANIVRGSGYPHGKPMLTGREVVHLYLRAGVFVFGSPTTVMYRSSLVRRAQPFFDERLLHEDTEKCVQILANWSFGFVYQVLSFLRVDDESISASSRTFHSEHLDRYIIVQRYASSFLDGSEAIALKERTRRSYYDVLAAAALEFREREFWQYHRAGLATLAETFDWTYLTLRAARQLFGRVANPGRTAKGTVHFLRNKLRKRPPVTPKDRSEEMTQVSAETNRSQKRA